MTKQQIDEHRDRHSTSYRNAPKTSPWTTDYESMAIKTVLKYPINKGLVPIASEHRAILNRDEGEIT